MNPPGKPDVVTLYSGGMDSTLLLLQTHTEGIIQKPLFVDYGQNAALYESRAAATILKMVGIGPLERVRIPSVGHKVPSGITDHGRSTRGPELPGRNLLLLCIGAMYAQSIGVSVVSIGVVGQSSSSFRDQSQDFIVRAEHAIRAAIGTHMKVLAPLCNLGKGDVVQLLRMYGTYPTRSCYARSAKACGVCNSCIEISKAMNKR